MVEILKPTKIAVPHIDAIHGHTIFELKDVNTGIRDRVESDNVVTDGAESFINSRGYFNNTFSNPFSNQAFGGLMLFDSTIPTTSKFKPKGTKMIGNGAIGESYSGVVTEMGTYNTPESSRTSSSVKMVWDFLTSQANGTIASVCLTSSRGGVIGYGNTQSGERKGDPRDLMMNSSTKLNTLDKPINETCFFGNVAWTAENLSSADTTITLHKYNCPIFENVYPFNSVLNTSEAVDVTVSCTAPGVTLYPLFGDHTLFLIPRGVTNGSSFTIYKVDLATLALTTATYQNSTGYTIFPAASGSLVSSMYVVMDDDTVIVTATSGTNAFILKLSDGSWEDTGIASTIGSYTWLMRLTPTLVAQLVGASSGYINVFDIQNKIAAPTNGMLSNPGSGSYQADFAYFSGVDGIIKRYSGTSSSVGIWASPNPLRLTTINNLPSAVTKDATKTMKVTYTLTLE